LGDQEGLDAGAHFVHVFPDVADATLHTAEAEDDAGGLDARTDYDRDVAGGHAA